MPCACPARPREPDEVEAADEAAVGRAERQRVAEEDPLDAQERDRDERVHERREHVLAAHHAAVEERQPGVISRTSAQLTRSHAVSPVSILSGIGLLVNAIFTKNRRRFVSKALQARISFDIRIL